VLEAVYTYDEHNRQKTKTVTAAGAVRYSAVLGYDLADNIRTLNETINGSSRNLIYDYDAVYRLTLESWGNTVYTYDRAGNRLSKQFQDGQGQHTDTYDYDISNALVGLDDHSGVHTTFTYDLNGNLRTKQVGTGPVTTYTWDVSNRLIAVQNGAVQVFGATYDYRTRRLTITEGAATTYFVYDGGVSIQERASGFTTPQAEFVYGSGLGAGIGGILYEERPVGTRGYAAYNHVGHKVLELSDTGTVTASVVYEAFGGRISSLSSGITIGNRLANTRELDTTTGLYNHGFRYYDPALGRYISRDPAGYADGPNLYLYVLNNPVRGVDPQGLTLWDWIITGYWNPAPNVREAAETVHRASGWVAGGIVGATHLVVEAGSTAVDAGVVVSHVVLTHERLDAGTMQKIAFSSLASRQAQQVAEGKWSVSQGVEDTWETFTNANPITGPARAVTAISEGIAKDDPTQVGAGIAQLGGTTLPLVGTKSGAAGAAEEIRTVTPAAKGGGAARAATTRPFRDKLKDITESPDNWENISAHVEKSTRTGGRKGGVSTQEIFRNKQTGEEIIRHTVTNDKGKLVEQHFRPDFKPRVDE
jgi:RHS repeat-associated protein